MNTVAMRFSKRIVIIMSFVMIAIFGVGINDAYAADRNECVTKINSAKDKAAKSDVLGAEATVARTEEGYQVRRNIVEDNICHTAHMIEYTKGTDIYDKYALDYWFDNAKKYRYTYDKECKNYVFEPRADYNDYKSYLSLDYYLESENTDGVDVSSDAEYKATGTDPVFLKFYKDIYDYSADEVVSSDGKAVECIVVSHFREYEMPKYINLTDNSVHFDLMKGIYNTLDDQDKLRENFDAYKETVYIVAKTDYLIGKDDGKLYMIRNSLSQNASEPVIMTVDFYYPDNSITIPSKYTKSPSLIKNALIEYKGINYCAYYEGKSTVLTLYDCKTKAAKKRKKLVVPDTIKYNGRAYKVCGIDYHAFFYNTNLKNVVIGKNVTEIGTEVFFGCSKIKTVTIKSKKLKRIGESAFYTDGNTFTVKVPKGKKKAYKKLLKKAKSSKYVIK